MAGSNPSPHETLRLEMGDVAVAAAARIIADGGVVAVPTETVYGLAADATDADAVARIYAAKGRPSFNPLIVHVSDRAIAETLGDFDEGAARLAEAFWPGPLTIVVPRSADCPVASIATAGLDTIALRCPAHPAMQAVIAATGKPLAAPSANASGGISPTTTAHVLATLNGRIPLVIDAGPCSAGLESTIVRPLPDRIVMLREGPVTRAMLAAASGLPVVDDGSGEISAPGQLASHYAPGKPMLLDCVEAPQDAFHIGFAAVAGDYQLSATGDLTQAAARLFDALHEGAASARHRIAVAPIPVEGLGAAIADRLRRAAA
jgi:L-threonylcarbamoyladenylate synthase